MGQAATGAASGLVVCSYVHFNKVSLTYIIITF